MIDLRSDTVTRPSAGMREAMAGAEVGDDVFGEDPAVNRLQDLAAEMLGMEAALLTPSGTMANLCALMAQTRPGDAIILSVDAHPYQYESGNLSALGGLMPIPVAGELGKISAPQVAERICQLEDPHFAPTTLAAVENTTNRGGGACYSVEEFAEISAVCREHGLRLHCDGARLFNAAIATGAAVADYARHCDTVCFCLSKGLGAPVGSILAGRRETIHKARRFRKMLGGGMRQAGVLAAAGLYALEHHVSDLAADHRRAQAFRDALEADGARFLYPSPTNILYLEADNAYAKLGALIEAGVRALPHGGDALRVVFHRDISDEDLDRAIAVFRRALSDGG